MNMISCALLCNHQCDGYCNLHTATAVTNATGGCPHFVSRLPADVHAHGAVDQKKEWQALLGSLPENLR